MRAIATIAGKELRGLFYSPSAWVVLGVIEFILGYLFLIQLDYYLQNQSRIAAIPDAPGVTQIVVTGLLGSAGVILMMVVPVLTMRSFSEERRAQTLTLLISAPVTQIEIVLGKYLGVVLFLALVLGLLLLMPLSLLLGGQLDPGLLAANILGLLLLLASFAALGIYVSAVTDQPVIAAVGTFGALLILWLIDWAGETGGDGARGVLGHLSTLRHYENLLQGLVDTQDLAYFGLFVVLFLALTVRRLDARRLAA